MNKDLLNSQHKMDQQFLVIRKLQFQHYHFQLQFHAF